MKIIYKKNKERSGKYYFDELKVSEYQLQEKYLRTEAPRLAHMSEPEISRHYSALASRTHGVGDGFYPLGSCTMKHNPFVNELIAHFEGFSKIHPLAPPEDIQGCLQVLYEAGEFLSEIAGMDEASLQPAAGAQGEFAGLLMIKAYHVSKGDLRTEIIIPDSAHGTNPSSANMAGFTVVTIRSRPDGRVDLNELQKAISDRTAGFMLTNPNTLGLFENDVKAMTNLVHHAGGLCYYDGANANAILGISRPGDMGFDIAHFNLHKTFAAPHGGGGPGSGPVCCKRFLSEYLPSPRIIKNDKLFGFSEPLPSIGRLSAFFGNFLVVLKAYAYIRSLGARGLRNASYHAVLNANYMQSSLKDLFEIASPSFCMHEFVISLEKLKNETGVSALDFAKSFIDHGMHPPTMYFPLIVKEALMIEPTETESIETLDAAINTFRNLHKKAHSDPHILKNAPTTAPISRPDEVYAARNPKLKYEF